MNILIENLLRRSSVRKFENKPIAEEELQLILDCALNAPTGGNMQNYSIIVTKDPQRRSQLGKIYGEQSFIHDAAVVLTFCCDIDRFDRWSEGFGVETGLRSFWGLMMGASDALLAAQNAVTATSSLGLGACVVGGPLSNIHPTVDFFELPQGVIPLVGVVIGVCSEFSESPKKLRPEVIIHREKYEDYKEELISSFEGKRNSEVDRYVHGFGAEPGLALEEVYGQCKYPKKEVMVFAENLFKAIESRGFFLGGEDR